MSSDQIFPVEGIAFLNEAGKLVFHTGVVVDPRLQVLITDRDWLMEAAETRVRAVVLTDASYLAVVALVHGGALVLFFREPSETVLRFFLQVDFAADIIEHILSNPFDGMAIVNADARLVFVSPIHEKFFGLGPGEGVGMNVRDVIENTRLHNVVRTGVAEIGQIQKMRNGERVVSRHPIRHDGKVVGAIGRVMFKGPEQVEALAKRINALEQEVASYKAEREEGERGESALAALVGQSASIQRVREQIRKIAPLDIPVLIQGESGTGKELVARALHFISPRHAARLVTVNAAALPASLVESELFGYEAGSFTGADRKGRVGKFEQADKGTIFLDEIGDMPLDVQSKLLRVLQDRIVERVGGDKPRQIDFRLCSATNRNLEKSVEEERFRLDLFYRISPVIITVPSLSERRDDIPILLDHFLAELAQQYRRPIPDVDPLVYEFLTERTWAGNVRELRHVAERAFVFSEPDRLVLADFEGAGVASGAVVLAPVQKDQPLDGMLKHALGQVERDLIADALVRFQGNKKKVAEHLGVSRTYLYKKLEELK